MEVVSRIESSAYRDGSRGQPCTLRMPGCTGGGEDTVFAHIRDRHTGRSIKASDTSGADSCFWCHERFDRRAPMLNGELISDEDWNHYAIRGLQETIERRVEQGILPLALDKPVKSKAKRSKSDGKGVKSKAKGSHLGPSPKIPHRKTEWPSGKIPSRKMRSA